MASYHLLAAIPVGGQGGWDDLSVDSGSQRLFMSHSDRVVVIDTEKNKVLKEILDTPGVHGIALALPLKKAFSSNGKENKVSVIDLATLSTKTKIAVGENPDAIVYEPAQEEVYAFNGKSHSVSVIDAKTEKNIATVALPGKPEFAAVDAAAGRIYVNIEDKNSVVALDAKTHTILATWALGKCDSPSGIAFDPKTKHLFSVCENKMIVVLDTKSGKVLASAETGEGTDGAAFDAGLGLAFSSNGKSATMTVLRNKGSSLAIVENVATQTGARTMTLDPKTHRLYLPTADFHPSEGGKRPKAVDGTQRILVYGP